MLSSFFNPAGASKDKVEDGKVANKSVELAKEAMVAGHDAGVSTGSAVLHQRKAPAVAG